MSDIRKITQAYLKSQMTYDPETGKFVWHPRPNDTPRNRAFNCQYAGREAGCLSNGFLIITIDRFHYAAHRLAWLYVTGEHPEACIDHIDNNATNNAWNNLRPATRQETCRYRSPHTGSRTGIKGVYPHNKGSNYQVLIHDGVKLRAFGTYTNIEAARERAIEVRNELHGEFARHV